MSNEIVPVKDGEPKSPPQTPPRKGVVAFLGKYAREILAVSFWFYVILKLFIFDVDLFLIRSFAPQYEWVLNYKFFIIIAPIAIAWLLTKNKNVLIWFAFIGGYPFVVLFWYVPYFLFKQGSWTLAFAFINAVISFFKSIKYNFIMAAFFLVPLAVVYASSDARLLWPSIILILIILTITYIHRFILVFKPSSVFEVYRKIFSGLRKKGTKTFALDEEIKGLPMQQLNEKQLERLTTSLQTVVLFNRACLFTARKLEDYHTSGVHIVSSVLTLLLLMMLTVVGFVGINYGLYKISPGFFKMGVSGDSFIFLYYSFSNLVFKTIEEVTPISWISQSAAMMESMYALFLIVIFASLVLSVRSKRYAEELRGVIEEIEAEGGWSERFIQSEYAVKSIEEAMEMLERLKSSVIALIYQLSEGMERVRER